MDYIVITYFEMVLYKFILNLKKVKLNNNNQKYYNIKFGLIFVIVIQFLINPIIY